ncbi:MULTISPECIES: PilT/PilU family type 4a pilus ATPase [Pseudomonas]|jgi:twitching motility protein PilU|uniref:Twitching motility protein PilU n=6 Tax=Pseudomonas syringae group TaxID=136849 RepID=A0AB38BZ52_PSESX|nr:MULTISPECIES: PilT/PilU family type 4a pilus ATPase [Pseudomonas]KEZ74671.1 twitching motility protein PilT [Pseudomonas syringae pv. syringae FF5]ALU60971.1 type IV pili twitching motility protein PilT [Pseudomonas syringae pv. lapsa]AZG86434.1 PilT/PilU family type 4a pilus ATPase [Pseudomonas syringae pv. pisi str. PP1]KMY04360.1 twitching motility protein PilT [Pseudomonas syringae KCTC 12500]KPX62160.1 Type IV pilus retraction ATPase PilT [Pseudomonas syringae pv. lapsa]
MDFPALLKILASQDGSDLYLSTGAPPCAKFNGVLKPLGSETFKPGEVAVIAQGLMDEEQKLEFQRELEMNLAVSMAGIGRFRINIFMQRNEVSIVARNIKLDIPRFEDLFLPPVLLDVIMEKRGLVLFVGATGSGKSTSLAALIDYRNRNASGHIITIEDPVEFIHRHKKSIVNQREVGVDTRSFHAALKNTLRQAPDVILIGEIRDRETMEHALAFADTGHLAISTLHANNANQALDRIINFFPEERRAQLLHDLGNNLKAFVSQRLVRTPDGKRRAAVEVMMGTPTIRDLIQRNELTELKGIMEKSGSLGMQTFDTALFNLAVEGAISEEEALKNADSQNNVRLRLKLHSEGGAGTLTTPPPAPTGSSTASTAEWGLVDDDAPGPQA